MPVGLVRDATTTPTGRALSNQVRKFTRVNQVVG